MKRLLAKSSLNPDLPQGAELLAGHTQLVFRAAVTLLETVGLASLEAVGLSRASFSRLSRIVRLAAFVHDLGKCSDDFQRMVRGAAVAQLYRHEAISLWLCWPGAHSPIGTWLLPAIDGSLADLRLALAAAAGHHRKFPARAVRDDAAAEVVLHTSHPDFIRLLETGAGELGLGPLPELGNLTMNGLSGSIERSQIEVLFGIDFDSEGVTAEDQQLLAVAKALVIDADVAGSALPKSVAGMNWLPTALRLETSDALARLVERRLGARSLRPFQEKVAASNAPVTFVRAGCGSGKTLAAWLWGARQHAHRQFWLCYPTTGTTTEGFRDYVQGAELHSFIEHSRARVDVSFFGLEEGKGDDDVLRDADRLRALRQWGADAITCTVDTVVGLLQNQRKGLYAWPGLCRSAVVFDEIHAFDDSLFGLLLTWLERLPGVPVLLMTASLPQARLRALRAVVERVHRQPLVEIEGPPELEGLARYVRSEDDPTSSVEECVEAGGKVLWVSNTVKRCVGVRARVPTRRVALYHSRFRYRDRVVRHGDVIEAFASPGAQIVSATQVAEMSLDLSADLLVTELAPIPSLIQRLGRLNRRSTPEAPAPVRPFIVVEPGSAEPYEPEDLEAARKWLSRLGRRPLSQADLVAAWVDGSDKVVTGQSAAWIAGGFATEPREVRESSPGVTVLLEADAALVAAGELDPISVALPMGPPPKKVRLSEFRRVAYHPVVPPNVLAYDEKEGGRWL